MRRPILLAVALAPSLALADAAVPPAATGAPAQSEAALLCDALRGGRCPDEEELVWERKRHALEARKLPPNVRGLAFRAVTAHRTLFSGRFHGEPSRTVVVTEAGATELALDVVADALYELPGARAPIGGLVLVDENAHVVTVRDPDGAKRFTTPIPRGAWGRDAAVLLADDALVIAVFDRISSGAALFSVDARTGAVRWTAADVGISVSHSEYWNDVSLERRGGAVVIHGTEAGGCYVQAFDLATGKRLASRIKQPGQ